MLKHRSSAPMRTAKWGYIFISAVMLVFGIMLIALPDFSVTLPGIICGIMLILFGIVRLVGYFSKDLYRLAFQYDLALGVVMIICGIMLLLKPKSFLTVTCIAPGLAILADSVFKLQISVEARQFGIKQWLLILISAILSGICSLLLIFRPLESGRAIAVMIGISLIAEAVMNIITMITAVKIINHQQPDIIDIESEE